MQFDTALAQIRDELTQPQAHALLDVIRLRKQLLADQRAALVAAMVTVGAHVRVRDNLNPAHLRGLHGTVQTTADKLATVLFDERSTAELAKLTGRHAIRLEAGQTRYPMDGIPVSTLDVLDVPAEYARLVTFVVSDAWQDHLEPLDLARKQRIDTLAADMAEGDEVMLTDVSPKFLLGLTGTVDTIDRAAGTCRVLLDEESTTRLRWQCSPRYVVPEAVIRHPIRVKFSQALIVGHR